MNRMLLCSEAARLNQLVEYGILDTLPEKLYDDLVNLAAFLSNTPMAAITLLDAQRLWLKARVGLDASELPRNVSFCQYLLQRPGELLVVPDTLLDDRFRTNPLVIGESAIRFYAGAPLMTSTGEILGGLCVVDRIPREFDAAQQKALRALADQVVAHLEHRLATRKLQERERHFQAFFEGSTIGVGTISADRRWIQVNDALCRIVGYERHELLRRPWDEHVSQPELPLPDAAEHFGWRAEAEDFELERRMASRDGRSVYVRLAFRSILDAHGLLDHFLVLVQDVTRFRQSEEQLWRQANFDALTGLPNRQMLQHYLEQECRKAERSGAILGFLYVDLDRFKEINDSLTHCLGDHVLRETAERIAGCVRQTDMVARVGADEFVAIVGPLEHVGQLERVAQAILDELSLPFHPNGHPVYLSASIGLTVFSKDNSDLHQIVAQAEQAMVFSKQQGRNGYRHYTPMLQEGALNRLHLLSDLHGALAGNQFRLELQPIVDLWNNRIVKAEALLRWTHPVRGAIGPGTFIPLAEESGLIIDIGAWVLNEAGRLAVALHAAKPGLQVGFNMSPLQFGVRDEQFDAMTRIVRDTTAQGGRLVIEITEGLLLNAEARIVERLQRLREAGAEIAIDDFGTGYSSLAYLKKFDIDYLKIDRSFIQDLEDDPDDMALSETIIVVAHKLGLKTVAEGVETSVQQSMLANAGCDFAQGFLFSGAVPLPRFIELLHQEEPPGKQRG